jgi:hypothetical protein
MIWYTYKTLNDDKEMVLCKIDKNTVISGIAEFMPEYLQWLAEGNVPEEFDPNAN